MKLVIAVLLMAATPAYALDLRDTLGHWKQAPIEDRTMLLKLVLDGRGDSIAINRSAVMTCMNQLADTRLLLPKRIVEMIEYCIKNPEPD
jgi:hypothetical protein